MSPLSQPSTPATGPTGGASTASVDASCRWPLLGLYYGAAFWLVFAAVASLLASMSFHSPTMFADCAWFSYGRMAPVAKNALLYGFCIPAGWAAALWMLGRLGNTPLQFGSFVMIGGKLWNIGVFVGLFGILSGDATGFASMQFPMYAACLLLPASLLIGISGLGTLRNRAVEDMYPSQWFAGLSMLWFPWIFATAVAFLLVWPVRGMAQAAVHWWFVGQLQVVLFGLLGLGILFYFLPLLKKQPLPSRHLAVFTLITFVFIGGWVGVPPQGPTPAWMGALSKVMSVGLIVPALALALVLWPLTTVPKSWWNNFNLLYFSAGLRCFLIWLLLLAVLRVGGLSEKLAFTLVQPALFQLLIQGFMVLTALGAAYYILPRVAGVPLLFPSFARFHFIMAALGVALIVVPFLVGGVRQGAQLADAQIPFTEIALGTLMPIRMASTGELLLILGHSLLAINLVGIIVRLGWVQVKHFDNAPAPLTGATEGKA